MSNNLKKIIISITFVLLTVFNSNFMISKGLNTYVEIISYLMLCTGILYMLFEKKDSEFHINLLRFCLVLTLLSIGIFVQEGMPIFIKIRLLFTSFVIACVATCSKKYLDSFKTLRSASYGIMIGILVATLLSLIAKISLQDQITEGVLNIGFNGGLQYKNFFATTVLSSFIGIYMYNKHIKKSIFDIIIMIIQFVLMLISSSRGTLILLVLFLFIANSQKLIDAYKRILRYNKNSKTLLILLTIFAILSAIYIGFNYAKNSANYMYRARGVYNYINFYKKDYYHLVFGDSKSAFEDPTVNYVWNIRKHINKYDGSYEMGFINVLIKNGIIGIIAYILIFWNYIKHILRSKKMRLGACALIITLLFSSLVESYVCNIHAVFGVFCYLTINGIIEIEGQKE